MLDKNKLADYVPGFQSRRTFSPQPPSQEELVLAQQAAEELAAQSGLTFTRFDQPKLLFDSFKRGKGFFRFAHYYYVISAKEDTPENRGKTGYFGQQLALYLTSLRLGCCWEMDRFDREKLAGLLFPDSEEKPLAVLLFGRSTPSAACGKAPSTRCASSTASPLTKCSVPTGWTFPTGSTWGWNTSTRPPATPTGTRRPSG